MNRNLTLSARQAMHHAAYIGDDNGQIEKLGRYDLPPAKRQKLLGQ